MTATLDYAQPRARRESKVLRRAAVGSLFLPLIIAGALYGEWLLAWWALGHPPRSSLDDPKDIVGSNWMHGITGIALIGLLPGAALSAGLNVAHVAVNRPPVKRGALIVAILLIAWLGLFGLLRWDPGGVVDWWFD